MRPIVLLAATCCLLARVHGGEEKLLVRTLTGHTKRVTDIAFSPDGKRLASAGDDATVRVWDSATGKEMHRLNAHRFIVQSVAFSPDGKWLASAGWDATVRLWEPNSGQMIHTLQASGFDQDIVYSVAFSPDSKKLVVVGQLVAAGLNEPILIYDVGSGKRERKLDSRITNGLFSVDFTRDGKMFATAGFVEGISLWDFASGRLLKSLKNDSSVTQLAFSPDGTMLASAGDDRMIRFWDVRTGRELRKLEGHSGVAGNGIAGGQNVTTVAFHPNGKLLASAAAFEKTVRLWDVRSGRELRALNGHSATVTRVAFHPNGKQFASAGEDGTVKLWDISDALGDTDHR
jgi:WD40 repeat protein